MRRWRDDVSRITTAETLAAGGEALPITGLISSSAHSVVVRLGTDGRYCAKICADPTLVRREAEALGQLDSALVTPLIESQTRTEPAFLFMRELQVDEVVSSRGQPGHWRAVAVWLKDVANCLKEVHAQGFLHLDVKPDNVLVAGANRILIDFGLACRAGEPHWADAVIGTAEFRSPEHWRCADFGIESDVYGLAASAYFLLAGHGPYAHDNPDEEELRRRVKAPAGAPKPLVGHPQALQDLLFALLRVEVGSTTDLTLAEVVLRVDDMLNGLDEPELVVAELPPPPTSSTPALLFASVLLLLVIAALMLPALRTPSEDGQEDLSTKQLARTHADLQHAIGTELRTRFGADHWANSLESPETPRRKPWLQAQVVAALLADPDPLNNADVEAPLRELLRPASHAEDGLGPTGWSFGIQERAHVEQVLWTGIALELGAGHSMLGEQREVGVPAIRNAASHYHDGVLWHRSPRATRSNREVSVYAATLALMWLNEIRSANKIIDSQRQSLAAWLGDIAIDGDNGEINGWPAVPGQYRVSPGLSYQTCYALLTATNTPDRAVLAARLRGLLNLESMSGTGVESMDSTLVDGYPVRHLWLPWAYACAAELHHRSDRATHLRAKQARSLLLQSMTSLVQDEVMRSTETYLLAETYFVLARTGVDHSSN